MATDREVRIRDLWENHPELSSRVIGAMFGIVSGKAVQGIARRRRWARRGNPSTQLMEIDRARDLWEKHPETSAREIAVVFNVTKGTVIGLAHRRGWEPRRCPSAEPPNLDQRLDALNAVLDAVLAACPSRLGRRPSAD